MDPVLEEDIIAEVNRVEKSGDVTLANDYYFTLFYKERL